MKRKEMKRLYRFERDMDQIFGSRGRRKRPKPLTDEQRIRGSVEFITRLIDFDDFDLIHKEIGGVMGSPSQLATLPISDRAKALSCSLIQDLIAVSDDIEQVRAVLLEYAEALQEAIL